MHRLFFLSPANSGGARARLISNPRARFELARRLQRGEKVPLGEIFSFLSGLYFRGKYAYSRHFASAPKGASGAYVITSNQGLMPADKPVSLELLESFSSVDIDPKVAQYRQPLEKDAKRLVRIIPQETEIVLLGSIGTKKYAEILMEHFQERLLFPTSFVGRGDMSRGGLLLRCVAEKRELDYVPIQGAIRHGKRPEKLPPKTWGYKITDGKTPV